MASPQQNIQSHGTKATAVAVDSARNLIDQNFSKFNSDAVLSMLQPIGDFSIRAFRTTFGYARKHPVRMAVSVIAIGLIGSWLASSNKSRDLH